MSEKISGVEAFSRMLDMSKSAGTSEAGATFQSVLDGMVARGPSAGGASSSPFTGPSAVRADRMPSVPELAGRLDDTRRRLDASIRDVERSPSASTLAKLAVVQSDYTMTAQIAVRGIQKTAQALSELTRLQ